MERPDIEHLTHIAYVGDPNANPSQIVRTLLSWVKHVEADLRAVQAQVEAAKELHKEMLNDDGSGCGWCDHCERGNDEDYYNRAEPVEWPCPTLRALGAGEGNE